MGTTVLSINPHLMPKLDYDAGRISFRSSMSASPSGAIVAVPGSAPSKRWPSSLRLKRPSPASCRSAPPAPAASAISPAKQLNQLAGTKFVHVPYRGSAPVINDAIGGHIPLLFDGVISMLPADPGRQAAGAGDPADASASNCCLMFRPRRKQVSRNCSRPATTAIWRHAARRRRSSRSSTPRSTRSSRSRTCRRRSSSRARSWSAARRTISQDDRQDDEALRRDHQGRCRIPTADSNCDSMVTQSD